MSVQELFSFQEEVLKDWAQNPRAWLVIANPVWGRAETMNRIALFDTKEAAKAYVEASLLPHVENMEEHKTSEGYYRTFRPDSLLFDYNADSVEITPAFPWMSYRDVTQNPLPPSGPPPDLHNRNSGHIPRYGVDYDAGFGGPYTNRDGVLPEAPRQ